jgi:hypothetical protein
VSTEPPQSAGGAAPAPPGGAPYTAYSYLSAGEDFTVFDLAPEFGRVPAYQGSLTPEDRERGRALLQSSIVISLHDHPFRYPARMEETPEKHPSTTGQVALTPPLPVWPPRG